MRLTDAPGSKMVIVPSRANRVGTGPGTVQTGLDTIVITKTLTCPENPDTTTGEWLFRKLFSPEIACAPYVALPALNKPQGPNVGWSSPTILPPPHGPVTMPSANAVAGSTSRQNAASTNFLTSNFFIYSSLLGCGSDSFTRGKRLSSTGRI